MLLFRDRLIIRSGIYRWFSNLMNTKSVDVDFKHFSNSNFKSAFRSHTCGELRLEHVGTKVSLCGWVQRVRFGRFLLLRDTYGLVQVTGNTSAAKLKSLFNVSPETVVQVSGTVVARPDRDINKDLPTGFIEICAEDAVVFNYSRRNLPFLPSDHRLTNEILRLENRYLDLRTSTLQRNLKFRSEMTLNIRHFLSAEYGFLDIETPYLFRRTPGGAREFVTPTCFPGHFYSLPQSPQQFKQLMMVGGIDRYMQIARCFRDERSRADKQPEFTQLDLEMAFVCSSDVFTVIENLIRHIWPIVQKFRDDFSPLDFPFPRMSYSRAMAQFGSDKPDLRFGFQFDMIESQNLVGFKVDCSLTSALSADDWKKMEDDVQCFTGVSVLHSKAQEGSEEFRQLASKLQANEMDTTVYVHGTTEKQLKALGHARVMLASLLNSKGVPVFKSGIHFLWIHDFPLFELSEEGAWVSVHHPFTAPTPETLHFIYSDPAKVVSQHYDLVCNGQEVGGGSIRIHDSDLQEYVLSSILKEDVSTMNYFLSALKSGAPPHGGIALAILVGANSIRDVIAFPKASSGKDLMCGAPAKISSQDLRHYKIALAY